MFSRLVRKRNSLPFPIHFLSYCLVLCDAVEDVSSTRCDAADPFPPAVDAHLLAQERETDIRQSHYRT